MAPALQSSAFGRMFSAIARSTITLPYNRFFKQEWTDGVILHEMAHYKCKHHRKSFWTFLSTLIGEDSKMVKAKDDIAMSPYYNYYLYLTKNK